MVSSVLNKESHAYLMEERVVSALIKLTVSIVSIVSSVLLTMETPLNAQIQDAIEERDPIFVVIMSDSVAQGVWADSALGAPGINFYFELIRTDLLSKMLAAFTGFKTSDLSDADRYSRMMDRHFSYSTRRSYSALLGNQEYSLSNRIRALTERGVELVDTSFFAGCYHLSPLNLTRLASYMTQYPEHKDPDILVVSFSGMDFIFNSPISDFEADVRVLFSNIVLKYPSTNIVVTPLADVAHLMSSSLSKVTIPGHLLFPTLTCADYYERIGIGSLVGIKPGVSEDHLRELRKKIDAMNAVIAQELWAMDARLNPYQDYRGRALGVAKIEPPIGPWSDYLSPDCFHPNIRGQKVFGDLVWRRVREILASH